MSAEEAAAAAAEGDEETLKSRKKRQQFSVFPAARIKKIMQEDEDVGKITTTAPIIVAKCVEMFLQDLTNAAAAVANEKNARTISTAHLKEAINRNVLFDWLAQDLRIPDTVDTEKDAGGAPAKKRARKTKQDAAAGAPEADDE
eukprot:m51a1_g11729 putative dr1-associated corepressor-like (144) ;mRNA; f:114280-114998